MLTISKLISWSASCQENQMSKSQRKKFMKDNNKTPILKSNLTQCSFYYVSGPHETFNCLLIEHEVGGFLCLQVFGQLLILLVRFFG